jgi:two-component system chemotaxis response regulator CheB
MAIVQDPSDAIIGGMPRSAVEMVEIDHVLPATAIAEKLVELVGQRSNGERAETMLDDVERITESISADFREQASNRRSGELTLFTCPDCGGSLWQAEEGSALSFRCHVGHTYLSETLLSQKSEQLEAALWASMRLLKERSTLTRQVANRLRRSGAGDRADQIEEQAMQDDMHVTSLRELIETNTNPLAADLVKLGGLTNPLADR